MGNTLSKSSLFARLSKLRGSIYSAVSDYFLSTPQEVDAKQVRNTLGWLVFARIVVLTLILILTAGLIFSSRAITVPVNKIAYFALVVYLVSFANYFAISKLNKLAVITYAQLLADVIFASVIVHLTSSGSAVILYALVIAGSALVTRGHGAVIVALLSALCYASLASGLLFSGMGSMSATAGEIFIVLLSFLLVALVSGYLTRRLENWRNIASEQQKQLQTLAEHQNQLINDISEGVITLDLSLAITSVNEAARAIMGLSDLAATKLIGENINSTCLGQGITDVASFEMDDAISPRAEMTLQSADDGYPRTLNYCTRPIKGQGGQVMGRLLIFSDISHLRKMEERLSLHERMTRILSLSSEDEPSPTDQDRTITNIVGQSPVMKKLFSLISKVSASDASVLIWGESGTGKELIARAIHQQSSRFRGPYVAVNCGAIPENLIESELFGHKKGSFTGAISDNIGLFRQAQGGTIFLDEIGELPLALQTKLLRVLQEKTVRAVGDTKDVAINVRVLSATNRDLKQSIGTGLFREDLYYRLNVVNIYVPPLRERKEDLELLIAHFVKKLVTDDLPLPKVSPEALDLLLAYPFPGNVRELENVIERALVLGGQAVLAEHLPEEIRRTMVSHERVTGSINSRTESTEPPTSIVSLPIDLDLELSRIEQDYLNLALRSSNGVKKQAAELLGLNFRSFRYRLKKYELGSDD